MELGEGETRGSGQRKSVPHDFLDRYSVTPIPRYFETPSENCATPHSRRSLRSPLQFADTCIDDDSELLSGLYAQRIEACTQVTSQLEVSIRRHEGLLGYVKSLQVHLEQNVTIAKADLDSRYHTALSTLSALYEDYTSQMDLAVKEKEAVLYEKVNELENFLSHLLELKENLDFRVRAEPKATFVQKCRDHISEAKLALSQWASDVDIPSEFLTVNIPHFHLQTAAEPCIEAAVQTEFEAKETQQTTAAQSLDSLQSTLLVDFQQLDQRRKEVMERSLPLLAASDDDRQSPTVPLDPDTAKAQCSRCSKRRHKRRVYHTERSDETQTLPIDERVDVYRKDAIILNLVKRYNELEQLYEWAKQGVSAGRGSEVQELTEANQRMAERVRKLEEMLSAGERQ